MANLDNEIIKAIEIFDEYGNCHRLSSLLLLHKDELTDLVMEFAANLNNFYNYLMLNNYKEIRNIADSIIDNINLIKKRNFALTNISSIEKFICANIDVIEKAFIIKTDSMSFPLEISKWCASKGLVLQSVTIFIENIGSFLNESKLINVNKIDLNIKTRDMRKIISNMINGSCVINNECNGKKFPWIDWFATKDNEELNGLVFIGNNFLRCKECDRYKKFVDASNKYYIKPTFKKYYCTYLDLFSINNNFVNEIKWIFAYSKYIRDVRNILCHPEKSSNRSLSLENLSISLVKNISFIIEKGRLSFNNFYNAYKEKITYSLVDLNSGEVMDINQLEFEMINLVSGNDDIAYSSRIFSIWELENNIFKYSKKTNNNEFAFEDFIIWLNDEGLYLDRNTLYQDILTGNISESNDDCLSLYDLLNSKMKHFVINDGIIKLKEKQYIN